MMWCLGMFMVSLFTEKTSSTVERFLMDLCFTEEIFMLGEGVHVYLNGKNYYIQARLVLHGFDTKAVEQICKVQASGSKAGCPFCRLIRGSFHSELGACCYIGHRYV
jgi:hypothetical protein